MCACVPFTYPRSRAHSTADEREGDRGRVKGRDREREQTGRGRRIDGWSPSTELGRTSALRGLPSPGLCFIRRLGNAESIKKDGCRCCCGLSSFSSSPPPPSSPFARWSDRAFSFSAFLLHVFVRACVVVFASCLFSFVRKHSGV